MSENGPIRFFLGSNAPQGFVSRFDQLDCAEDWHTFIIKGGPGCGKSSLMRRICSLFESRCPKMEQIVCSSDPDSLDAVILPEWKVSVADGTAPHILEPKLPAVCDSIVNLGEFLNQEKLYPHTRQLKQLQQHTAKNYTQASDCLNGAKTFLNESSRIALACCDTEKLGAYAKHFACRHFPAQKGESNRGKEQIRFLSSVNAQGITSFYQTVKALCPHICFFCDRYSAAAPLFLSALRSYALENGYSVISCYCPIFPHTKIDHLLIPQIGLAVLTDNPFHNLSDLMPERRIHAKRFLETDRLRRYKKRLAFQQKAAMQLIDQAVQILAENKQLHDETEQIYLQAMDFSKMDDVTERLVFQITERSRF